MRSSTDVRGLDDGRVRLLDLLERSVGEVVANGVRQHEVAVGQTLHQRRGAEAVGAVVGEVGLTGDEQAGDRRHQVVVDPDAAHDVVHGGVDAHRHLVGVLTRDPLVHVEEVVVLLLDAVAAETLDGGGEVEVDTAADSVDLRADPAALVADVLRGPRRDVARDQVAEGRVDPLEVVVAVLLGDVTGVLVAVGLVLRAPRCGRRCGATRSSGSAWTGGSRRPGCRSGGSACSRGWPCRRPCGVHATRR